MSLLDQLATGDRLEMWEAAKAIVAERNDHVAPKLLELMETSSDPERRVAAAWTLGFLRSGLARESLMKILDDKTQPTELRDQAAESLGYLGDSRARDVLTRNLLDQSPDVVFSCAFALRTVGQADDIPHLQNLTHNPSLANSYGGLVAQEAREAIKQIQSRGQSGSSEDAQ